MFKKSKWKVKLVDRKFYELMKFYCDQLNLNDLKVRGAPPFVAATQNAWNELHSSRELLVSMKTNYLPFSFID